MKRNKRKKITQAKTKVRKRKSRNWRKRSLRKIFHATNASASQ